MSYIRMCQLQKKDRIGLKTPDEPRGENKQNSLVSTISFIS